MADPALDALFLPIDDGTVPWPADGTLFLRAREGVALFARPRPGLVCEQGFRPAFDALQRAGFEARAEDDGSDARFGLVLLLPPRQRDEARALFARAWASTAPGGVVVASMANDAGAKSGQADFERLFGGAHVASKHKCRVFHAARNGADSELAQVWRALDAPRPILDGRYTSRPGVFAWDRIDAASKLLAQHLPDALRGHGADLGAGWGYLSDAVLSRCTGVTALDVVEAEARALACARNNLAPHAPRVALDFLWRDVTQGLPRRYDFIVSNPPFHALGGDARPDIGRAFIAAAANALRPGGVLWLVANRQLPYEQVLDARFASARTVAQQGGFKVVEARKST
ncbi:class I SAM-dependent methyltransferase [Luteimonas aestuarii]|uniref:Class I SAM-dependent methyltransferase n=1 Tax=Luteimonas aestuarii TaxID=453837 RepID=A0A4R5TLQ7_9GAMM|nr:class I SAM-dependent methyltransferase [Luteimonas aestuarii]TDK23288.1 class I SAM-dependent methyltransferase [Luteimonas aestuarii]